MQTSTSLSLKVVIAPDPKLKVKCRHVKKINNALLGTLEQMVKLTKTFKDPQGVGLAANQVGLKDCFFVAKDTSAKKKEAFLKVINPKLLSTSKRVKKYFEGCLSVPGIWGEVNRHTNIKVSFQDETGQNITKVLSGIQAWIFQHEIDHLIGTLFSERVLQQKGKFYRFTGKDKTGTDTFEEILLP